MHRFLEDILARRRARIQDEKDRVPTGLLLPGAGETPPNPVQELRSSGGFIVAEVKRASPSRGPIAPEVDAASQAAAYERGGAAAVSVLCEPDFFGGSRGDVRAAASAVSVPVLCKDFIMDPVQLRMARADGARWALLIARILGADLAPLVEESLRGGLEPLVEVHSERELADAVSAGTRLVGINARDLDSFEVDLDLVKCLARQVPEQCVCIAESGIRGTPDMLALKGAGAHGFLIGETLMTSSAPEELLKGFVAALRRGGSP